MPLYYRLMVNFKFVPVDESPEHKQQSLQIGYVDWDYTDAEGTHSGRLIIEEQVTHGFPTVVNNDPPTGRSNPKAQEIRSIVTTELQRHMNAELEKPGTA